MTSLETLRDLMIDNDSSILDEHGQWSSDLPTFGGEQPADTTEVWSWDEQRLLVGTCADDLEIIVGTPEKTMKPTTSATTGAHRG